MSDIGAIITSYNFMANNTKSAFKRDDSCYATAFSKELTQDQCRILALIEVQLSSNSLEESKITCPECTRPFSLLTVNSIELDCCRYCKSYWFDTQELSSITGLDKDIPSVTFASRKSKYSCPVCKETMSEYTFNNPYTLLVDRCIEHGVYLESGELKRAFDIINKDKSL